MEPDFHKDALQFAIFTATSEELVRIEHNKKFVYSDENHFQSFKTSSTVRNDRTEPCRETTARKVCSPVFLCVTVDDFPRIPQRGFVFGSDPETCDILLEVDAPKEYFSILIKNGLVFIKNLSSERTLLLEHIPGERGRKTAIGSIRHFVHNLTVFTPTTVIAFHGGDYGDRRTARWRTALEEYSALIWNQPPHMGDIALRNAPSTITTASTVSYVPQKLLEGSVYLARHWQHTSMYVAKRINAHSLEAKLWKELKHPSIFPFHALITFTNETYLIAKYLRYRDLQSTWTFPSNSYGLMQNIAIQLLNAVTYLHDQGITHRNIHPSSILVDVHTQNYISIKLSGFSQAIDQVQNIRHDRKHGFLTETLYMAPEMTSAYSSKVDEFAIGVVFLFLSGRLHAPFLMENIHPHLKQFLDLILEPDPQRRATTWDCRTTSFISIPDPLYGMEMGITIEGREGREKRSPSIAATEVPETEHDTLRCTSLHTGPLDLIKYGKRSIAFNDTLINFTQLLRAAGFQGKVKAIDKSYIMYTKKGRLGGTFVSLGNARELLTQYGYASAGKILDKVQQKHGN